MKISIIVPVYNVEKYISTCINSIISQTFKEWELILINDGSKDSSGQICDEYAHKDTRIKVIHKKNNGVSSARNVGIENAKYEWICFVDSDDWLENDYLENFIKLLSDETEMVIQSFWFNYENNNSTKLISLANTDIDGNYKLVEWLENTPNVHNGFLWHRIFKRIIIEENHIRFEESISFAEDGWFFLKYIKYIQKIKITSAPGYHYLIRNNSLTSTGKFISPEVYKFILCGYIDALKSLDIPIEEQNRFQDFTKKYAWRLAESWFLRQWLKSSDKKSIKILNHIVNKYNLDNVKPISCSLSILINLLNWKENCIRDLLLKSVLHYRELKQKIIRHL